MLSKVFLLLLPLVIQGSVMVIEDTNIKPVRENHSKTEENLQLQRLRESEEKYRILFETIVLGVVYYDNNGKIISANPAAEKIFGLSHDQMQGKTSTELRWKTIHGDGSNFPGDIHPAMVALKTGKKVKNVIMGLLDPKNKQTRWININATPIYKKDQKTPHQIYSTFEDITEQQKDKEDLSQNQKLLQDIINGFPSIIFVKDVEGQFLIINNKLEELLGVKNVELKGKTDFDIFTKDLAEYYRANDQKVLEERKAIHFEEGADLIDGHHTFIANKFPLYDSKGKPYGVGSISTDITERKLLEEQLKKAHDNLEQKVQERTEELLKSNIELKRSNEELERFAYVSSHDLQEPLRMVTLYSQLLERRYKDNLDSDANDFIEYIIEGAQRMRQLIDDLLEYSRIKSQAAEFEKVNLENVLDFVLHNLAVSIVENNVTISHKPLPIAVVDKNQMIQVFQNLISNAIKFHGKNPPDITIAVQKDKEELIFEVSDNGIGIKPEHQKQIFEVFKRLHTREQHPGTGIGLSITQKIINHHGGRIWVESELGKGSTFYFTIPIIR
jgi:PAS domain S-box-containing protein